MSRRIARTWRNLAVLLFSLPLRVTLGVVVVALIKAGEGAEWVWDNIDGLLPGLEDDAEHAYREHRKRHAQTVEGYKGERS